MSFLVNPYVYAAPVDPDCAAFLTATGITNPTISGAVCTLVTSLKSANLWTKFDAIYPFVGGTSTTHMYNLRNPANTNAAFRLSFLGGWTHTSNGAQPGINGYADTFYNPNNSAQLNNHHLSYYSRTQSNATEVELGNFDTASNGSLMEIRTSGISYFRVNNNTGVITFSDSDSRAFYLANRTASNLINAWRNSSKLSQSTSLISSARGNLTYYLAAINNNNNPQFYSTKQCAWASIGQGFSDTEASTLYTIIQTFQTTIGRQVP